MQDSILASNGYKRRLTYFKGIFNYAFVASVFLFLASVGIFSKLLFWNQSVFVSTTLMFCIMFFYLRKTLRRAERVGLEKDALDFVRKKLSGLSKGNFPNPDCEELIFDTDKFLEKSAEKNRLAETFVADYFRDTGTRIAVLYSGSETSGPSLINTGELRFCFFANMERLIIPTVNAGKKLLLFGFLGTVVGILLIGLGMEFGETASQTLIIAKELISGLGVAALTTILGIVGNLILGSFYEQHEDIRDRIASELTRITIIHGLDLYSPPLKTEGKKDV